MRFLDSAEVFVWAVKGWRRLRVRRKRDQKRNEEVKDTE
jgi:hypothetical protein